MIYFLAVCACLLLLILWRSHYEVHHFIIKKYRFQNCKIKSKLRIVFLSDLHETEFGMGNKLLIDAIRKEKPDCILIGGDLIIGKGKRIKTQAALHFLKEIQSICPCVYTYGNHETRVKDREQFIKYKEAVEQLSIQTLNNDTWEFTLGQNKLCIHGLELEKEYYKKKKFLAGPTPFSQNTEGLKILIAHTPNYFKEYLTWNPDYVFSGHNHGGIVRLPRIGGVISTDKKLFPHYSYGIYEKGKTKMILSAGAGTHTIPFRLFNMSEIVVIDFEEEKNGNIR